MFDAIQFTARFFPRLKRQLNDARMTISVRQFITQSLRNGLTFAVAFCFFSFVFLEQVNWPLFFCIPVGLLAGYFAFQMHMNLPALAIIRRAREIDNEVLFAARFLLIKLNSGRPLFNALIETSQSYGVAAKYFKEIVDDINFGTPIENALQRTIETSKSRYFKKVLFQISNALKIGVDVSQNLQLVIKEIEDEQALEIERYSKKLASIALFYMLVAIVMPSLGLTIFIVLASLINLPLNQSIYGIMIGFVVIVQLFFMSIFRQIRPSINI